VIIVPTREEIAKADADFDGEWGGVDEVLYELCRRHPDRTSADDRHTKRRETVDVQAKGAR